MRTTIGLDFGTHQTKVCVERRESGFVEYEFMTFMDRDGAETFFLPSMVQVCADNKLKYGFVDDQPVNEEAPAFEFGLPEPQWVEMLSKPQPPQYPAPPTSNKLDSIFGHAFYKSKLNKWEKECKQIKAVYERDLKQWERKRYVAYDEYKTEHTKWERKRDTAYALYVNRCREWRERNCQQPKKLYRYFKQATFLFRKWENEIDPILLSIWYMAYIIFEIEERYGKRFALNMGVPTGKKDGERRKELATSLVLSAYRLVDDVFQGDKKRFLECTHMELERLTEIVPYSAAEKKNAAILVFPEAVACLRPLLLGQKVDEGKMHTMIDIGGGTTDISFFTIKDGRPHIFSFQSIPHGLNYLTRVDDKSGLVHDKELSKEIDSQRINVYHMELKQCITSLLGELQAAFKETNFDYDVLYEALKGRPIIYTGGGSTFKPLRKAYHTFSVMLVDHSCWRKDSIINGKDAIPYCPLLSTAYGLAIFAKDDFIELSRISTLFNGIRKAEDHDDYVNETSKHSFHDDWRYKDYGTLSYGTGGGKHRT